MDSIAQSKHRIKEENALLCANFFQEMTGKIEEITPAFRQMFYDFAHLKKGELIMGCARQDEWAQKYAKRTARALRYMFEGENQSRALEMRERRALQRENKTETCSVSPSPAFEPAHITQAPPLPVTAHATMAPEVANFYQRKLQARCEAAEAKVAKLQKLVAIALGPHGLSFLSDEERKLYDEVM